MIRLFLKVTKGILTKALLVSLATKSAETSLGKSNNNRFAKSNFGINNNIWGYFYHRLIIFTQKEFVK